MPDWNHSHRARRLKDISRGLCSTWKEQAGCGFFLCTSGIQNMVTNKTVAVRFKKLVLANYK
jgi:hypothetical protein